MIFSGEIGVRQQFLTGNAAKLLQLGNHRGDGIEKPGILGAKKAAEQAGGPQAKFPRGAPAKTFIHQHDVSVMFQRESGSFCLAQIETCGGDTGGDLAGPMHFDPAGQEG